MSIPKIGPAALLANMGKYDYPPKDKVVMVTNAVRKPSKVTMLATGEKLDYTTDGKTLTFPVPADRTIPLLDVIKVEW